MCILAVTAQSVTNPRGAVYPGAGDPEEFREFHSMASSVRDWLVRITYRGLDRRFDRKSTGRKKTLDPNILKKITEWTRMDPLKHGFESASRRLDMAGEMIRMGTGRRVT